MQQGRQPNTFHLDSLSGLSPEDRVKTNDLATKLMSSLDEAENNHVRPMMQNKMMPAQLQEFVG